MIKLNVLFKKMQKDDKKEVLVFQVQGDELPQAQKLVEMAGGIVVLSVQAASFKTGEIQAEFATLQRDSKKTALKFNIKGDNEKASVELYRLAGMNVELSLQSSQMSIDEFYDDDHEGVQYTVNPDGTVEVDQGQMTLEEAAAAAAAEEAQEQAEVQDHEQGETSDKVADIAKERKRRGRPRKQDKDEKQEEQLAAAPDDELPPLASDDDLPF
ncbi:hypothetical protein WJ0W_003338 [Paenibacillus melissococcoides]|uniref:Uncharacterized protein n=1 Tax=Paenibacillus melissococcoides TaxID=2912268 RepID=A0ABN8U4T0_9BACL|nr:MULTISPECIES: hypothetical protein [Paenibacillus]MEB9893227.1 hypothetical protein [Bacillus cereus]CAH8246101.1 hypothetical protein WJ0W_003338 [Paenibacillus melissococcoides]CAH8712975.1 hypothetical protein WDD9_003416 [Paenibacillus melissococcoides]CAH8713709.1 hypothetical protein HTL2_003719 [Paenibacillus melissococcoides]GIO78697.1 hypothetical protein J6TS7_23070 [Paenibacillus dendritiformis]